MILNLENLMEHFLRCKFSRGYAKCLGCNMEGLYDEILIHSQTCENIVKKCTVCGEKLRNKFFEEHEKKCLDQKIICKYCDKEFTNKEIKEHEMSKECLYNMIMDIEEKNHSKDFIYFLLILLLILFFSLSLIFFYIF
jgi:hypothetical protein